MRCPSLQKSSVLLYLLITACTPVPYQNAFPLHYGISNASPSTKGAHPAQATPQLTEDVVATLPLDFALAHELGYLQCILDDEGHFLLAPFSARFVRNSSNFRDLVNEYEKKRYPRFNPNGYPNLSCFMPAEDPYELMSVGWLTDWTNYVSLWQSNELEIEALKKSLSTTHSAIATNAALLNGVNAEIVALDAKIAEIDTKISVARQRLAGLPLVVIPDADYPPFDPKIPYDKMKDPFYEVPRKYLKDVSNKPWLDRGQASGPFIDHELAEVLDKVHETLSDPKKFDQLPPDIKQAVQDTGFKLKVVSGSRTPWKQAAEIPQAKAKGLPAADYSKSNHMFGQEVDIEQPHREGTEKYKSVEKIMNHFGLQILKGDRVHILMPNKTFSQKVTALAMIREYKRVASNLRATQASTKQNLIFLKDSAEQQKQQLEKDLEARRSERDKKAEIFEKNSAVLRGINADIQRKEAEAREAERRNRGAGGPDRDFPRGPREAGGGHHDMGGSRGRGEVIVFDKPEVIVGRRP